MIKLLGLLVAGALTLGAQISSIPSAGGSGAPSGAAGGKLSGTYPNPGLNAASTDLSDTANLVRNNAGNTWSTGAQSFAGATSLIITSGSGAPSATACDAAAEVGSLYARTGVAAYNATFYVCENTGAATYAWVLKGSLAGTGITIVDSAAGQTLSADTSVLLSNASAQTMMPFTCIDAGANDTYACNITPALAAYPATTGLLYVVLTPNTANTGAATLNIQAKGAKPIYKNTDGTDLSNNDLRAGIPILLKWDAGANSGNGAFFVEGQLGNAAAGATANQIIGSFGATFDGGGAPLVVGTKAYTRVPFACTVTGWSVIVDTGTATIDVWRQATAATDLPAVGDEIAGTGHPAIAANNVVKAAVANWTSTAIAADDVIAFNIDAASGVTWLQVVIECDKS